MSKVNYRALLAEELARKNSRCDRCVEKNRRYEENMFLDEDQIERRRKAKAGKLPKIGRSRVNNSSILGSLGRLNESGRGFLPQLASQKKPYISKVPIQVNRRDLY